MKVKFKFGYGEKLNQEELKLMQDCVGKKIEVDEKGAIQSWNYYDAELLEIYEIKSDIKIEIGGISPNNQMARLSQRMFELESKIDALLNNENLFNEKCEVHVPGLGLLAINETKIIEDCCTDQLDDYLIEGWRIVAACPQPDQRRPDYVLGRTNRNRA